MVGTSIKIHFVECAVGYVSDIVNNNYCYFIDNEGISIITGYGTPIVFNTSNSSTAVGSDLIYDLNLQETNNDWNKWFLNSNTAFVLFEVNNNMCLIYQITNCTLPSTVSHGKQHFFKGWFTNTIYSNFSTP